MTHRVLIGIDIGITGAIASLADGERPRVIDMPTRPRKAGGLEVDGRALAAHMRGLWAVHHGASFLAIVERVYGRPAGTGGEGGAPGSASTMKLGQADGMVRGVLEALGFEIANVEPQTWKRYFGLIKQEKGLARRVAAERHPCAAPVLCRKKDTGRAEALLIAIWRYETEQGELPLPAPAEAA